MKIMSDNSELTFSNFGIYDLVDQLELILPNTLIKFHRIGENAFSYYRKNSEGEIVDCIQSSGQNSDGLIINAAGFSHTSVALLDALLAIQIPKIEIHLTNLFKREDFRHHSFISKGVNGVICGFGSNSYLLAVDGINKLI